MTTNKTTSARNNYDSDNEPGTFGACVRVQAKVIEERDGIVSLEIPARQMTEAENQMLRRLFPHLSDQAYTLLSKEALIAALVE